MNIVFFVGLLHNLLNYIYNIWYVQFRCRRLDKTIAVDTWVVVTDIATIAVHYTG